MEELHLSCHNDPQTAVPLHSGFRHHVLLLDSQSQLFISSDWCESVGRCEGRDVDPVVGESGPRSERGHITDQVWAMAGAHTGVPGLHAEHTHKVFFIVTVASSDTAKVDEVHTR